MSLQKLPDDARVVAVSALDDRSTMTLGEACALWKDSRHFGIDRALIASGEYRALGLTIHLLGVKIGEWSLDFDPPPIPARDLDWSFAHDNYDASWEGEEDGWVSNGLGGRAASPEACLREIAKIEADKGLALTEAA